MSGMSSLFPDEHNNVAVEINYMDTKPTFYSEQYCKSDIDQS